MGGPLHQRGSQSTSQSSSRDIQHSAENSSSLQTRTSSGGSQQRRNPSNSGSSSGGRSSSGKASRSARSHSVALSNRSSRSGGAGYDGNRDSTDGSRPMMDPPKNLDLGAVAWGQVRKYDVTIMPPRPAPSKLGQPIKMGLNTFNVEALPKKKVYQFEVFIGNGAEKPGLIKKIWESKAVQKALGKGFIFDGKKLAWSSKPIEREVHVLVDIDAEENRPLPKSGKENKHRIAIRQTNVVRFDILDQYLQGKTDFDVHVLESINFLDHLLRDTPSRMFTQIKRSFFARGDERYALGNGIEAFKGAYQSMRIVHAGGAQSLGKLSINVDVANGTFWTQNQLHLVAVALVGARDPNDLIQRVKRERGNKFMPVADQFKKLRKLHVTSKHRGSQEERWVIERIVSRNAREVTFEKDGRQVSVYDYFLSTYNIRLQYPDLPLAKMTKKGDVHFPMELLHVNENQRYVFKLDERQTSMMIKFAATPPPQRWQAIEHGLRMLSWDKDAMLAEYGLQVNRTRAVVDARLLPAPKVQFGAGDARPGTSGRWDLKGKKFLTEAAPLKTWGVCVVSGRGGVDKSVVTNFVNEFCKIYTSHGGRIENRQPFLHPASGTDASQWVTQTWNGAGNQTNSRPQMLMFILPDKNSMTYGRIKRSADCRYGVVTQCLQYSHVQKAQGQYISNVCMKFHAKLGGTTARAVGPKSAGELGQFSVSTCVIGADVSHAAPGSQTASMAAITMSTDKLGIRYAAACETNGFRVEMITEENINSMVKPLLQNWVATVGGGKWPSRIIYFRDGVSEGQYQFVLSQEVADMKKMITAGDAKVNVPFVVIVGGKRHHVRFFPEQGKGDRNGNPFPGTLVETGVTHPFENDFFLCSHAAIKGTARPMHYHVLLNEAKMSNEELQTLIYEQCYQYIRATTPISQHPAIYYAHIAALRAVPHDPKWGETTSSSTPSRQQGGPPGGNTAAAPGPSRSQGSGGKAPAGAPGPSGGKGGSGGRGSSSGLPAEFEKLLPMPNQAGIHTSMWFI